MTTIAWDGELLAADRQATIGNLKTAATKIWRLGDGRLFGSAGERQDMLLVLDWLNGKEKRPSNVSDTFCGIVVASPGTVYRIEDKLVFDLTEEGFCAIGSGSNFALAAMALGKDALEAVALAARFDPNTGGAIDELRIGLPQHALSMGKPGRRRAAHG